MFCGVVQDGGSLAQLHIEGALSYRRYKNSELALEEPALISTLCVVNMSVMLPAMIRSEAPSRVKTRSTGVKRRLSAGT